MKIFATSAFLILVIALGFGMTFFKGSSSHDDLATNVLKIKIEFQSRNKASGDVNFRSFLSSRAAPELSLPKSALPQPVPPELVHYAETCDHPEKVSALSSEFLQKAFLWHKFQCGFLKGLPAQFFSTAPFLHPNGRSYAWLEKEARTHDAHWIQAHFSEFHLLEILNDPSLAGLNLSVSAGDLSFLLQREPMILTSQWLLLSNSLQKPENTLANYQIFARKDWDQVTKSNPWLTVPDLSSPLCLLKEASFCWISNPSYQAIPRFYLEGLLLLVAGILVFAALGYFWKRQELRLQLQNQKFFILQMLTHELRTPATSLQLNLEAFRQDFDTLPTTSQKAFLQMSDEIQRLNRVVEASQDYLHLEADPETQKTTTDLNTFVAGFLERYENVELIPLPVPIEVRIHRRWMELCLKNLVENALHHGRPPVSVRLLEGHGTVQMQVQDEGRTVFQSLDEMSRPFHKSSQSSGLGLGISVVRKILERIGGTLEYQASPTRFTIQMRTSK